MDVNYGSGMDALAMGWGSAWTIFAVRAWMLWQWDGVGVR